jgi:mRNA-degrading endonuclease toxin of MazEF toxin-antitoxin module
MKYHQRDVVEINFPIPGEGNKVHPAIIVSNDELQINEGFVYLVMISSQDFVYSRQYAYPLTNEMLSFEMEKQSYVKCQLLAADVETGILRKLGTIKEKYFNEIVDKVIDSIF